tara:strand:- start:1102 stop:1260 length:159 start_codon:yes stop_codon:yes gene_type:complete
MTMSKIKLELTHDELKVLKLHLKVPIDILTSPKIKGTPLESLLDKVHDAKRT